MQLHPQKGDYAGLTPQSVEYQKEVSAYNGVFVVTTTVKGGERVRGLCETRGQVQPRRGVPLAKLFHAPRALPPTRDLHANGAIRYVDTAFDTSEYRGGGGVGRVLPW